jgi:hypothetical protein
MCISTSSSRWIVRYFHACRRAGDQNSERCLLGPAKEMAERKVSWATHLTAHLIIHSQRLDPFSASLRRRRCSPLTIPLQHTAGSDDASVPHSRFLLSLIQHTAGSDDASIPSSWRPGIRARERIRAVRTTAATRPPGGRCERGWGLDGEARQRTRPAGGARAG